jgi:hypothetical protein
VREERGKRRKEGGYKEGKRERGTDSFASALKKAQATGDKEVCL